MAPCRHQLHAGTAICRQQLRGHLWASPSTRVSSSHPPWSPTTQHSPLLLHTGAGSHLPEPPGARKLSADAWRNQPWLLLPPALSSPSGATNLRPGCRGGADNPQPTPPLHRTSPGPLPCAREEKGLSISSTARELLVKHSLEPCVVFLAFLLRQQHFYTPGDTNPTPGLFCFMRAPREQASPQNHPHKNLPKCPRGSARAEEAACLHPTGRDPSYDQSIILLPENGQTSFFSN